MQEETPQNIMSKLASSRIPRWVDGLWLLLLALYIVAGVQLVPLHGDETTQLYMARDFYTVFLERDTSQVTYQAWDTLDGEAATQQDLRLKDGILHRYLFGAVAYAGGYDKDSLTQQWVWGAGWNWNHANGHVPPDDLLFRARYVSAGMLAFGMLALYCIAYATGGRFAAFVATLLYATSPALLLNGRRAMMEGAMTLFTLLVVMIGIWIIQSRNRWGFILLGIFSGLAVASKHTSAVTVAAIFFACLCVFVYRGWQAKSAVSSIRQITYLILAGILSLMVFYALNPAWWSNPIARADEVSDIRLDFIQSQRDAFGGYESLPERLSGFFTQTFGMQNMYAETEIDDFIGNLSDEIENYEASLFSGVISTGTPVLPLLYALVALLGMLALVFDNRMYPELRLLIGVWAVAMLILTIFLTPLEWQRYYLPAYPVLMLLAALGINSSLRFIYHRYS